MHVCFICDEFPPAPHGGSGSSYRDLSEGLVALGHQVTVVGVYRRVLYDVGAGTDTQINGVRVVCLPPSPKWFRHKLGALADRHRLKRWLHRANRQSPFDIIEASDYGGWLRFATPGKARTIVRIRGSNAFFDAELQRKGNAFEHDLERATLAGADFIASVSGYAARRTLQLCGLSHRPCTVIYNAVDTALFSPSALVPMEPGLVVYVNTINPKKGIEQLIDAMPLVGTAHPEARLVVIGKDTQNAVGGKTYLEKLQERIHPEWRSRIIFTGRLDRHTGVVDYLRRANVCCYPSHMETFGIAALEAMSVGKPTIFSRTGPGPEVLEDGISGLLCDPTSSRDIADKLLLLLNDKKVAAQMAENARQRVLALFDKKDWVRRNLEFYQDCLQKGRA